MLVSTVENQRTTSSLLYLRRDEKILLAMKKRSHGAGKYNGVGGKPEPGEAIEQTAIRECQEEIGVTPVEMRRVADLAFYQNPYVDQYSNHDVTVFECTEWDGNPTESEEMAPRWFSIDEIPYDHMWPDDAYWLPEVLKGHTVTGTFHFNDRYELVSHRIHQIS